MSIFSRFIGAVKRVVSWIIPSSPSPTTPPVPPPPPVYTPPPPTVPPEYESEPEEESKPYDPIESFIHRGEIMYVYHLSSNVGSIQYSKEDEQMTIQYKWGGVYLYNNISPTEAYSMVVAASKGIWVWDNLRVRGTKKGHKKPYRRLI
jgi:hypothetical protein